MPEPRPESENGDLILKYIDKIYDMYIISIIMFESTDDITRALQALGEKMEHRDIPSIGLVVCGGAALHVAGLIARPTIDLDVLALERAPAGSRQFEAPPREWPEDLGTCVREVADDLGLDETWVNTGPAELFENELPAGMMDRLTKTQHGSRLRVYWVTDRADQVCLKLFATANRSRRQAVHQSDLERLKPSEAEMERAVEWCLTQKRTAEFVQDLKRVLSDLGREDLAYYLE